MSAVVLPPRRERRRSREGRKYSYPIYLLHFFFIFGLTRWLHTHV
jgi:peptidoglycan/LPS O-acetylase OafA/YrhL